MILLKHQQTLQVGASRIIAGTSDITVSQTVKNINAAQKAGADAALVLAPYYIKPSQDNMIRFFTKIHDETNLDIIIYNNPGRAFSCLSIESIQELAKLKRFVAIKESVCDVTRTLSIKSCTHKDFSVLCGEDNLFLASLACKADGIISVTAGIRPKEFIHLMQKMD